MRCRAGNSGASSIHMFGGGKDSTITRTIYQGTSNELHGIIYPKTIMIVNGKKDEMNKTRSQVYIILSAHRINFHFCGLFLRRMAT